MNATSLLCLLAALAAEPARDDGTSDRETRRGIELKTGAPAFPLGAGIQMRAAYLNPTATAWKVERPESSFGVLVKYRVAGERNPVRMAFSLANKAAHEIKLPDGSTRIVQIVPPRVEIEIQPGGRHELTIDLSRGWTEELAPGDYEAWIEDTEQRLESRKVRFSLVFSKDSVAPLLETVASEEQSPARRKWCASWLQRIQPDFELKLEAAGASPEALRKASEANAAAIRAFREHWERVNSSEQIEALFQKSTPKAKEAER